MLAESCPVHFITAGTATPFFRQRMTEVVPETVPEKTPVAVDADCGYRYHQLGDGVTVPVIKAISTRLLEAMQDWRRKDRR